MSMHASKYILCILDTYLSNSNTRTKVTPKNKFTIFLLINHNMYLETTAHNQNGYDYAIFDNCVKHTVPIIKYLYY